MSSMQLFESWRGGRMQRSLCWMPCSWRQANGVRLAKVCCVRTRVAQSITPPVAANSLQLPRNPLHFRATQASNSRPFFPDEEDDDSESSSSSFSPTQMTLTLLNAQSGRSLVTSPSRRTAPPSKIQVFFETVVNTPSPDEQPEQKPRPRLVYIRGELICCPRPD
jgi:hypothetical protein